MLLIPVLITVLFLVLGFILFCVGCSAIAEWRKIKKSGVYCEGVVVGMDDTIWGFRPVIAFEDASGNRVEGMAKNMKRGRNAIFRPGDKIGLYYLPAQPEIFLADLVLGRIFAYFGIVMGGGLCLFAVCSFIAGF